MIDEITLLKRNITELQAQLQTAYKRIEELLTLVNSKYEPPGRIVILEDDLDLYNTEHDESDDIEEVKTNEPV